MPSTQDQLAAVQQAINDVLTKGQRAKHETFEVERASLESLRKQEEALQNRLQQEQSGGFRRLNLRYQR